MMLRGNEIIPRHQRHLHFHHPRPLFQPLKYHECRLPAPAIVGVVDESEGVVGSEAEGGSADQV